MITPPAAYDEWYGPYSKPYATFFRRVFLEFFHMEVIFLTVLLRCALPSVSLVSSVTDIVHGGIELLSRDLSSGDQRESILRDSKAANRYGR
jgi:hypothetical protein